MSKVELISLTPNAEKTMAYIARVSNPKNQENEDYSKLLSYCIKNEHWSVFEQSFMTLQIETNRGIAAQILRHRSFTFQEFSQRYADSSQLGNIPLPDLRRQDFKNRQNSIPDLPDELQKKFSHSLWKNSSAKLKWTRLKDDAGGYYDFEKIGFRLEQELLVSFFRTKASIVGSKTLYKHRRVDSGERFKRQSRTRRQVLVE